MMKLEKGALVAQIVSGIAVVITLVFLVLGIRDNTAITRVAVYEDLLDNINQFNLILVNDKELAAIWTSFRTGKANELKEDDYSRLVLLARVLCRTYESAYFSREYEILGPMEWERFGTTICNTYGCMTPTLWNNVSTVLSSEFVSYVENGCSDKAN